jgi:hypothetical protein
MRQFQIVLGVTVLALGFLSVGPGVGAAEPPEIDTNGDGVDEPLTFGIRAAVGLPFQTTEKLSLGAVTID